MTHELKTRSTTWLGRSAALCATLLLACAPQASPDPQAAAPPQGAGAGGETTVSASADADAPEVVPTRPETTASIIAKYGPAASTDEEIAGAARMRLFDDPAVGLAGITVEVDDGIVTLSGEVDHLLARRRAVEDVRQLKGVRSVIDRLSVAPLRVPDARLRRAVEETLAIDPATSALAVEVRASDGAVTLSGEVESFAERRLAEEAAASVLGVRSVDNDLSLQVAPKRNDAEIRTEIRALLAADRAVRDRGIVIDVRSGDVTLSGVVGSAAERARAMRQAWVRGVKEVEAAQLEVDWTARDRYQRQPGAERAFEPEAIASYVAAGIARDPRVDATPKVRVRHGVATLEGSVGSVAARVAAEDTASNTVGVWRVRNLLSVEPAERLQDAQLEALVQRALARDPYLYDDPVTVAVSAGVVQLGGRADDAFDRIRAAQVASRIGGVVTVQNLIAIPEVAGVKSDWELYSDVLDNLYWSYWVDQSAVEVGVSDGAVTLAGEVEDWQAYVAALQAAWDAGALKVRDRMRIEDAPAFVGAAMDALRNPL